MIDGLKLRLCVSMRILSP